LADLEADALQDDVFAKNLQDSSFDVMNHFISVPEDVKERVKSNKDTQVMQCLREAGVLHEDLITRIVHCSNSYATKNRFKNDSMKTSPLTSVSLGVGGWGGKGVGLGCGGERRGVGGWVLCCVV
jgi:hypothetical protein